MDASMTTQLSKLRTLDLKGLQQAYQELFGKKSKSRNREWLFKTIARKLQDGVAAEKPGDMIPKPTLTVEFKPGKKGRSKRVAKSAKPTAEKKAKPIGARDPRLPKPGTTITREWHGKKYLVRVLEQGFEFEGKPYRSLSALAKHITGQIVNGYSWFRLGAKEPVKS